MGRHRAPLVGIALAGSLWLVACAEPPPTPPSSPDAEPSGLGVVSDESLASAGDAADAGEDASAALPESIEQEEDDISEEELAALLEEEAAPELPWNESQRERIAKAQSIVRAAALEHGVEPDLINAVIWVESKFDPRARGPAGARGMMQLMPKTARGLAKRLGRTSRPQDPDFNIHAGTLYLARLTARLDGDEAWALVAYNRGIGRALKDREAGKSPEMSAEVFLGRVTRARAAVAASEFHLTLAELRELEQLRQESQDGKNGGAARQE